MRVWKALLTTVRADLDAAAGLKGSGPLTTWRARADVLALPGTWAVVVHRISAALHRAGWRWPSTALASLGVIAFSSEIHPAADIGPGLVLAHPYGVSIGPATVGRDARLMGNVRIGGMALDGRGPAGLPIVDEECWFFDGSVVVGAVHVGARAVISTNAVVSRDLPPDAVAFGDPARVIRYRSS